jgi:hypothetical protein
LSNGLIGLRLGDLPLRAGVAIVSGLSSEHPVAQVEAAAMAPYPLADDIRVTGDCLLGAHPALGQKVSVE